MTKKIAISIPDDVAERLAAGDIDNVSAYVTEAVRRRIAVEHTRTALRDAGFRITDAGVDRWRRELADRGTRTTPGMWQDLRDRIDRIAAGDDL